MTANQKIFVSRGGREHVPATSNVEELDPLSLQAVALSEPPAVTAAAEFQSSALPPPLPDWNPPAAADVMPIPKRGLIRRAVSWVFDAVYWLFGFACLIGFLAALAAAPIFQFLALGYLLEAAGRLARTGRLRTAFMGVRTCAHLGAGLFGLWLITRPIWLINDLLESSRLIDPQSQPTQILEFWSGVAGIATIAMVALAALRGGRFAHYFRPVSGLRWLWTELRRGGLLRRTWTRLRNFVDGLHLGSYFSLGLRGYIAAMAWLVIPSTFMAAGRNAPVVGFIGGFLLIIVVLYVPFLQMRFATENRLRAGFEFRAVREHFQRAPIAFFIAFTLLLWLTIPLFLFKIGEVPQDALMWLTLPFIAIIFPLKLIAGWAYGRATRKTKPAHFVFRWSARLLMLPTAIIYAYVVFFNQYTGLRGAVGMYEHHAFLLPAPF